MTYFVKVSLQEEKWVDMKMKIFKAWLVSKGFTKREGVDFEKTFLLLAMLRYSYPLLFSPLQDLAYGHQHSILKWLSWVEHLHGSWLKPNRKFLQA